MTLTPDVAANTDALDAMLADPEIRQSLAVIVANAPTLAALAAMGTGLLQRGPELTDNINGVIRSLREDLDTGEDSRGGQLRTAVSALAQLAPVAETLATRSETIQGFLDSAILRPEIVQVVGTFGEAALEADKRTRGKQAEVGSIFALNRVLKEPEVQETLAFFVEFARVFGAHQRAGS
ncbi:MAG: DUF1641 domain-containing protein [Actinobacteria bacterium]|nr:DUF1641 domain-containing protein [Actinomycetota bacterium]